MRKLRLLCLVLQLCLLAESQKTFLDSPSSLMIYRFARNWIYSAFGKTGEEGGRLLNNARHASKVQDEIPINVPFPCNTTGGRSSKVPTSVHRLRPGDIDVVASMGDSLTAGAGIFGTSIIHIAIENRGVTAGAGGQGTWRKYITLPNILKEFNPNLIGYALGDSLSIHPASQLNVAESGAFSQDMPFMAEMLVKRMKADPRIDIKKHWKMISLSIGSNNFCSELCALPSPWIALEEHKVNLMKTLRILRDNLPRTFVSVIVTPHLQAFVEVKRRIESISCYLTTTIECGCLMALQHRSRRMEYYDVMTKWQKLEEEICDYPEFHTKDFTVISQPVLKGANVPVGDDGYTDMSYLSSDCFHFSQKTNAIYANGLWNNLLEPIGNKSTASPKLFEKFLCPTSERPYITTRINSHNSQSSSCSVVPLKTPW